VEGFSGGKQNPKKNTVGEGTKALGGEQNGGSFVHLVKKYM